MASIVRKDYYPSGAVRREVTYVNNVKEGPTIEYYESGAVKKRIDFLNGEMEGVSHEFYDTGELKLEEVYRKSSLHGLVRAYYKTGEVQAELSYIGGRLHGECKVYYGSGILKKEGKFYYGDPIGEASIYHETGKLKRRGDFFNEEDARDEVVYEKGIKAEKVSSGKLVKQFFMLIGLLLIVVYLFSPESPFFNNKSKKEIKHELKKSVKNNKGRSPMLPPSHPSDGLTKTFYSTGELYGEWNFLGGQQHGVTKKYFKNGNLMSSISYRYGILDGPSVIYHESGRQLSHNIYKDGFLIKEEKMKSPGLPIDAEPRGGRIFIPQDNKKAEIENPEDVFDSDGPTASKKSGDKEDEDEERFFIDQGQNAKEFDE